MDENERPGTVGEVVTPAEDGAAEQPDAAEMPMPQSHEDNRRFQAARRGGERAGYERAMRELAGRESERQRQEDEQLRFIADDAREFARRYGRESVAELYADYLEVAGGALRAAQASRASRAARSTGSGGSGSYEALNARQRSELDAWNRAFPQMKMTAREYLTRSK